MVNKTGPSCKRTFYRHCSFILIVVFSFTLIFPPDILQAQIFSHLPVPGTLVVQTPHTMPLLIKGIEINPQNPFSFNFIVDTGDFKLEGQALQEESMRLIKYFLASLTVPEKEMWVNLSPYEKERIIPDSFGKTGMGLDLLAEDYLLKQLTASLMYPEKELGKKFWEKIYARAKKEYGISDIPMDSFHKVWIVPKDAEIIQIGNRAFVGQTSLEVMMEEDYEAMRNHVGEGPRALPNWEGPAQGPSPTALQTEVMKEIVLPEIEKEVNNGETFARLRQIYNAMVLAAWYKIELKESILNRIYVDKNKVAGINIDDPQAKEKVYDQYVEAFKKGVYDYIKEDEDPVTGEIIPRHYFSGGFTARGRDGAMLSRKVVEQKIVVDKNQVNVSQTILTVAAPNSDNSQTVSVGVNLIKHDESLAKGGLLPGQNEIYEKITTLRFEMAELESQIKELLAEENIEEAFPLIQKSIKEIRVKEDLIARLYQEIGGTIGAGQEFVSNMMQEHPERVLSEIRKKYPKLPEFTSQVLLNRLLSSMTSREYLVHDVSLEAIISELEGDAQTAEGKGGLGFLTGETWGAYDNGHGFGLLYDKTKSGVKIDWEKEKGINRVYVKGRDGKEQAVILDIEMGGKIYKTGVFWINRKGTPVFEFYNEEINNELYPDPDSGEQRMKQYGFIAKAYVAMVNYLGVGPEILRLNEAQLVFVAKAVENDIKQKGDKSVFKNTKIVMTNHTPERAALPVFDQDRWWLESLLGRDLVDDDMYRDEHGNMTYRNGRTVIRASEVLARKSFVVTTVSEEHGEVTKRHVLPQFAWKTTYIQNGSDPDQWHTSELQDAIDKKGFENISGLDLFMAKKAQKPKLNAWLGKNGFNQFADLERPLFAAIRRVLEYKEQGIFIAMVRWITGDADKEYDTPWGRQKGLESNFLIGGPISDGTGAYWAEEYRKLQADPEIKGKLVFIDKTGTDIMQLAASAADAGWLEMPRPTREASGTSHQRAMLNGTLVIASATGGQLSVIDHGENGWLVDVFKTGGFTAAFDEAADALDNPNHPWYSEFVERYRKGAQVLFGQYMTEVVNLYNAYKNGGTYDGDEEILRKMERSFFDSHKKIAIGPMMESYQKLFEHVLDGTGAAGYESRQIAATRSETVIETVKGQFGFLKGDAWAESIRNFLMGRGPAVNVIEAIDALKKEQDVERIEARALVISAWLMAAYGLDKETTFRLIQEEIDGKKELKGNIEFEFEIRSDIRDLMKVIELEYDLRWIDQQHREGKQVAPEHQPLTRKELGETWQSLEDRRKSAAAVKLSADKAMIGKKEDVGGIDFNAAFLNLKIRRDDSGMPLPANQQPLEELMMIEGLVPVIINITPIQSLPLMLGLEPSEEKVPVFNRLSRLETLKTPRH